MQNEEQHTAPSAENLSAESPAPDATVSDNIKPARKAFSRAQLNLALFYVIYFVVAIIVVHFLPENYSERVEYLAHYIPMYLIAFPLYLLISKPLETAKPEKHKMTFFQLFKAFLVSEFVGIAGNFIGMFVNLVLSLLMKKNTSSTMLVDGIFGENALLFLFLAVICAPFVEEMLFRKVLIDRIRKYGNGIAILISGIMFGLFHGNFTQVFYASFLGMLFAFIYIRTGKIQYTIGLHMSVNFWGTAIPYLAMRNQDFNEILNTVTSMDVAKIVELLPKLKWLLTVTAGTYMFALAGLVIFILHRKDLKIDPPIAPLPKGKRFMTACCNLGCLALLAVCGVRFLQQLGIL
ncbi:MAG: CPBP family intramembrane metalloprotease [Oscillospiraceae bacterium]|nr:CPBP family intramembrane metalloprotease [Oscillospiraceae bacterium]